MEYTFVSIYRFFSKRRSAFWLVFLLVLSLMGWGASQVTIEENITRFFPNDERVQKLSYIFQNSDFAERIVVMVSVKDSSTTVPPDSLVSVTEKLTERLEASLSDVQAKITDRIDDELFISLFDTILRNFPLFLTKEDYRVLDSLIQPDVSRQVMRERYRQLISPSGIALKKVIMEDPMGFSFIVLKRLQQLQYDDNFELFENYIVTKDHRHLAFFIQPGYASNETGKNTEFIHTLDAITNEFSANHDKITISFFGAAAVAVGNSQQLRQDTVLTLSLLGILLGIFILGFFRDLRVLMLILVPVAVGALFALFCIWLLKGSVSVLALAAGSVILGVAVNYALHFLVHLRYNPDKEAVIKDLVRPMTLGSVTTVLAFFGLQFTNAAVLKDIGLFAGFSLIGAALCSLVFLPHLTPYIPQRPNKLETLIFFQKRAGAFWVWSLVIITPVLFYFATEVKFNSDMSTLNFMNDKMRAAQERLETINPASLHSMYLSTDGSTLETALRKQERVVPYIDSLVRKGVVKRFHTPSLFLASDSLQSVRLEQWRKFWSEERKHIFLSNVKEEGRALKFSPSLLSRIDTLINRKFGLMDKDAFDTLKAILFNENIIPKNSETAIISLVNVLPQNREKVQAVVAGTSATLLDRKMITNLFVEFVHDDFIFIVTFTSILVFVVLLVSTGRIELTMITFMPMLITWIWILGIMTLIGIEFNIVNVMISTFIFGLGDDYSIFVMDGLLQEYKTGKQKLKPVRISILLSALTTISGLGVLIIAGHPALRSIAAIAIIGIVCVFIMSQTIEPLLFSWLITNRTKKGLPPMHALGMIYTFFTYSLFVFGSFFLTAVGLLFKLAPFARRQIKWFYHALISFFTRAVLYTALNLKKKFSKQGSDIFQRPGVIIANHTSFLDILITAMLHPKVILLTNRWVWNSPVFGGVVRLADYYPVAEGVEQSIAKLKARVNEGFSIVVFPEGKRSQNGDVRRFHKGAFYLSERLQLPVYLLLIHGAAEAIPKSTMYVNDGVLTVKALPAIEINDPQFGETYTERTKMISHYFRKEHNNLSQAVRTPRSCAKKLYNVYRYKGPVLEWYLRIKLKLENDYSIFDSFVPKSASILDVGCGYGFLCYMLQFLSDERSITGFDYDKEKIQVATNGYVRSERLNFICADANSFQFSGYDVIILADVLHYLLQEDQYRLLQKCFTALNPGGKVIIRDGDSDLKQRHGGTRLTELFSTRLLKFNKSEHDLNFVSGEMLRQFSYAHGFKVETIDQQAKFTSNVIFVLSRL